ncbi:MAG: histidine phosphatase family protein [Sphingobacteriales bacterium]|jgi:phosphohistidine phosphatase|nr:histidine phosphatase family protein [Sphingobacteriales bacterium]OJW32051.1 MAG: phosphohistidine phosphatase [Sphingobacteriales bacterium 46-32]
MKTLMLIRHAKSSWNDFSIQDFDRPLNDRGKRDAPMMAQRIREKGLKPDALLASPAKRARKTAEIFAEELDYPRTKIDWIQELYLATPSVFSQVISRVNDEHDFVAVFSHNNGLTDFANQLTNIRIDNIPTCGIFAVKIPITRWSQFPEAEKEFWFFDYPKNR